MKTTVSSKNQIVLPAALRRRDGIRLGQRFEIVRLRAGQYLLKKVAGSNNEGLVDWLLACPEKGWCKPLAGECTDVL